MQIDGPIARKLLEVGYYAMAKGQFSKAEQIFSGLLAVRPESEYPVIALAILKMNSNKAQEAAYLIRNSPQTLASPMGRAYLAMALQLSGLSSEATEVLEEVIQQSGDQDAVGVAKALRAELGR